MHVRFSLVFLISILAKAVFAQPVGYYDNARNKSGNDLKDALHEIFGIGHYSLETTKQKRSFFINEINSRGKIKITRQRRVDDQRSYDYLISSIK